MITLDNLIDDGKSLLKDDSELNEQEYIEWVYRINNYCVDLKNKTNNNLLYQNCLSAMSQFVKEDDSDGKHKRYIKYHYFGLLACLKSVKLSLNNKQ